ncbi:MAG: ATP synthase F1 subunit gamma [Planctomycetes bacterium]|nr:ATP synthase F1 subunit gamma [Planctomycetota bacterium]
MAKTRELVGRRKAIRNIRKITRTMELIATARFKKALDRAQEAQAYTAKIAELARDLAASGASSSHPLLEDRPKPKKSLLLVVCSNRGLCGGYNASILREANGSLRKNREGGVETRLELSGKRAIAYFRFQRVAADESYTQFEDKPRFDQVEEIADKYLKLFLSGEVDRVEVASMKFISPARQTASVQTLLPLGGIPRKDEAGAPGAKQVEYEFAPSAQAILDDLLPASFKQRLFKCFLDAAVSEQIARRVTMKAATENADGMIKSISRQYNRARQAQITKEIAEVIGGAAALE